MMGEQNIGTLSDKNDRQIMNGDIFNYLDAQWIAMYDEKLEEWIGHPIGSNLATEDIILSEVHNDVEIPVEE